MADTPERAAGRARLDAIADTYLGRAGVAWMRMFGATGLSVGGRVFAFADSTGALVVKLPGERVSDLHAAGTAAPMTMRGRAMREWATVGLDAPVERWRDLVAEAHAFVEELGPREPR